MNFIFCLEGSCRAGGFVLPIRIFQFLSPQGPSLFPLIPPSSSLEMKKNVKTKKGSDASRHDSPANLNNQ